MDTNAFLEGMRKIGVTKYFGVPDSLLKPLCNTLYSTYGINHNHVVAANEGGAVGLAAGHFLASGKPALVYMQNSGIGNTVNPIASLLHDDVYAIPCVFVIGWRGEPGTPDEPQHRFQGKVTLSTLKMLEIATFIITKEMTPEKFYLIIREAKKIISNNRSVAFVMKKGSLSSDIKASHHNDYSMKRETAIEILLEKTGDDVVVCTTGKASRELFEIREKENQKHDRDFLVVGSMGHANMISLGIAMQKPDKNVWCIDGDGAMVMHLGNACVAAQQNCTNFIHVVLNNGAHETVGGIPVVNGEADFCAIAKALGYGLYLRAETEKELKECVKRASDENTTVLIEVMVSMGARADLGRPTSSPKQNKSAFMDYLSSEQDKQ